MTEAGKAASGTGSRVPSVREVMHTPVISVAAEDTLWTAMEKMIVTRLHHIGVVDGTHRSACSATAT